MTPTPTTPTLSERAEAVLAVAEKMTPGPWRDFDKAEGQFDLSAGMFSPEGTLIGAFGPAPSTEQFKANKKGVFALRNLAPDLIRDLLAEIERLKAGGCARDQGLTQYCAEAAAKEEEIRRLKCERDFLGNKAAMFESQPDEAYKAKIAELEARVAELESLISQLACTQPAVFLDDRGKRHCHWCGNYWEDDNSKHSKDCPWVEALKKKGQNQ